MEAGIIHEASAMNVRTLALTTLCLTLTGTVTAKDHPDETGKRHHKGERHDSAAVIKAATHDSKPGAGKQLRQGTAVSDKEKSTLRRYYATGKHGKGHGLPPGLAKNAARGKPLPPGWQMKLGRGQVIDPVVLAHAQPLPPAVLGQLPRQPDGTILVTVDNKAIRLYEATRTIVDVFDLK